MKCFPIKSQTLGVVFFRDTHPEDYKSHSSKNYYQKESCEEEGSGGKLALSCSNLSRLLGRSYTDSVTESNEDYMYMYMSMRKWLGCDLLSLLLR